MPSGFCETSPSRISISSQQCCLQASSAPAAMHTRSTNECPPNRLRTTTPPRSRPSPAKVDLVEALTFNSVSEAIGVACAAADAGLPASISFTLDSNHRLHSGPTLQEAIESVDAECGHDGPAFYGINCSHPLEFLPAIEPGSWFERVRCLRPNAAMMDKIALCTLGHLESGDPVDLGRRMGEIASCIRTSTSGEDVAGPGKHTSTKSPAWSTHPTGRATDSSLRPPSMESTTGPLRPDDRAASCAHELSAAGQGDDGGSKTALGSPSLVDSVPALWCVRSGIDGTCA